MNAGEKCFAAVVLTALLAAQPTTAGWIVSQVTELRAIDGFAGDSFGSSLAVSRDGTLALIGSPGADHGWALDSGSAYVFARVNGQWVQQAILVAPDGSTNDYFGGVVALSGDGMLAFVTARNSRVVGQAGLGSVYVFTRVGTNWSFQAKLRPSVAESNFGMKVAVDFGANYALVSAYDKSYVFQRTGNSWTEQALFLYHSDAVALDGDGDTALIGNSLDDIEAGRDFMGYPIIHFDQGSAVVLRREEASWIYESKLTKLWGATRDQFGNSVALTEDGNTALVGAVGASEGRGGVACVLTRAGTNWTQQSVLMRPSTTQFGLFAWDVAISSTGRIASMGDIYCDTPQGARLGVDWIFSRVGNSWKNQAQLCEVAGTPTNSFANSVALSGDGLIALASASGHAPAGAVFVYELIETPEGYNQLSARLADNHCVQLRYVGLPGTNYVLEGSPVIMPAPTWTAVLTNTAPPNGVMTLTNCPGQGNNQFWRMRTGT